MQFDQTDPSHGHDPYQNFATALALGEVVTQPQAVKTHFDPLNDQDEVVKILRNSCAHMKQALNIESI